MTICGARRPSDRVSALKSLAFIFSYLSTSRARRNVRILIRLLAVLAILVAIYSIAFHLIMEHEGQRHSWITGVYWTMVVMSTLGFGDITFQSDLGRIFTVVVLLSGSVFILVLLPFTFVQFIYVPWMEARRTARAPRSLPPDIAGHVLLTTLGPIEDALITRAERSGVECILLVGDVEEALTLSDRGYRVMVGALDDPQTYRSARVDSATLVATTSTDTTNTNVAFTVREISETVLVLSTASKSASVDILELAGSNRVLQLGEMLGDALAQRVMSPDARSHVIGEFGDLLIAEASAASTPLIGETARTTRLRERVGLSLVGLWNRGAFEIAGPDTVIRSSSVLVLAGSRDQLAAFDATFALAQATPTHVIIVGGGRVGRATGRALATGGIEYRIVESRPERIRDPKTYVEGDAADLAVLQRAGLERASSVVITTHDDDVNVYLTIYCRRLRPEIQVIARANLDRNVSTLHRAGADFVLSYASTGAAAIWNSVRSDSTLVLAEGLDVFRTPIPPEMVGKPLTDCAIHATTGCHVVAIADDTHVAANPDPAMPLPADAELVLIGDSTSEDRFLSRYAAGISRRR